MEIKEGSRIFVDTAPIIYFIESNPIYTHIMDDIFSKTAEGSIQIITSTITFIEVLTKPYMMGQMDIVKSYKDFFYNSFNFSVIDISSDIALLTAKIRASFGFKLPDAVQLAVFEYTGCDMFITNDNQLKKYDKNKVFVLSNIINHKL